MAYNDANIEKFFNSEPEFVNLQQLFDFLSYLDIFKTSSLLSFDTFSFTEYLLENPIWF